MTRGQMQVVEGGLPHGTEYLLLGADEEGGKLVLLDDAKSMEEAEAKAELFLEQYPDGGIIITRPVSACYRTPLFEPRKH